ncbi:hypothetical protein [Pseudoroseicyclus aestuarii]|uniref:Sulfotransferase family protein n=1 Tax=Pseudoroseicyclus aestuarii TaxID=1795041 RepID=A0A318TBX7_9RHOB|nr:hypothetical protein [Pseudoroseicyclus aestuarii]PYE85838.1 hypothetical protein DFP88_101511 [Pseudoroseicyclus aestuarii]
MAAPFDTVFVLCTGRCGSTTLARAAAHLPGWTAGHETRVRRLGADRLAYPARHIEVDNRLAWMLGRLGTTWGDRAGYLHLTRDPEAVAESFAARAGQGILRAYREGILYRAPGAETLEVCRDYVATVTANIEAFLATRAHVRRLRMEEMATDFEDFADWIGAGPDRGAARAALAQRHNARGSQ